MGRTESFTQYAADCVRQAEGEQSAEDKNILLNMALAWVRLAQQAGEAAKPVRRPAKPPCRPRPARSIAPKQ